MSEAKPQLSRPPFIAIGAAFLLFSLTCFAWRSATGLQAATQAGPPGTELPSWVKSVGDRKTIPPGRVFQVKDFGAANDGVTLSTGPIQKAIDACSSAGGGTVAFEPGTYLSGALFLKHGVHLRVDEGVKLLAVQDETAYPKLWTRVAGIEMEWPAAFINVNDQTNVRISGKGTIDGNGELWWKKYWNMRRNDYEPRGLRWAVDYDCERVRLLVVWKSSDVALQGLWLRRAGFWTVQICYSDHVTVDGIKISDNGGPSTDGVDIDSSSHVLVENCDIDNNDDCICLKSGRDYDGLRVNRPAEYVVIRNNVTRRGGGIVSFGSETSGGIRHIVAYENRGIGTSEGIRFKSAKTRGGVVEDVLIRDTKMENVPLPFTFTLNWNPSYSYATIPKGMDKVPAHWKVLNTPVEPPERGLCEFRGITIANVEATGARRIISASGLPGKPLSNLRWEKITVHGREAGMIEYARDWTMKDVRFYTSDGQPPRTSNCENVESPEVVKEQVASPKQAAFDGSRQKSVF